MYGNIQSETRSIKCGVPQRSILGPLLFIIYMNDICNVSEVLYTIMYADDTSVIMSGNYLKSLIQSVNSELCLLNTWLKANKLALNVNKTYYLVFHRARIKIDNDTSIRMWASNDTAYKRWSCHSGLKLLCKLCRTFCSQQ